MADYFAMLGKELVGRPYVKSHHNRDLRLLIDRSPASVEFKHRNISAVLTELGVPIIAGYRPAWNFQGAIFDAIERHLDRGGLPTVPLLIGSGVAETRQLFEVPPPPPMLEGPNAGQRAQIERLVRKFDPIERDFRNRQLGDAGEQLVLELERASLREAGFHALADRVRWTSKDDGDGAGYDVHSFDSSGADKLIEVKTTMGGLRTPFFITRNELAVSEERPRDYHLYRVFDFAPSPRLFKLRPPLRDILTLDATCWRASFGNPQT